MTFPLPGGICRQVCRPKRSPPRQMEPRDVARLALATVKNGYSQCDVLDAVRAVISCPKCKAAIDAVDTGLQALEEDFARLLEAILALLGSMGIPKRTLPGDKYETEIWWRRLLRMINLVVKVREFVAAVLEVYEAVKALNQTIRVLIADIRELMKCCSGDK
jgi:hypothetical protein